ncbi:MAG TPA: lipid-binding SYLF domain-containing protein [Terriglobales bacterium]|nr:lipid-binding SYLF domain-containing protein [Terriglobales bacterium]
MKALVLTLALLGLASLCWAQSDENNSSDVNKQLDDATRIVKNMTVAGAQNGIPHAVLDKAQCVAVIPKMVEAGFIVGGRHGTGVATCRTSGGHWSAPAPISLSGGSFGAQIGGGSANLIMLAMTPRGKQELVSGDLKLGAGVSAAGPMGDASAGTTTADIVTYSRLTGGYAGATVNGAHLSQDKSRTKELYGSDLSMDKILNGQVQVPANSQSAQNFVQTIQQSTQVAQAK